MLLSSRWNPSSTWSCGRSKQKQKLEDETQDSCLNDCQTWTHTKNKKPSMHKPGSSDACFSKPVRKNMHCLKGGLSTSSSLEKQNNPLRHDDGIRGVRESLNIQCLSLHEQARNHQLSLVSDSDPAVGKSLWAGATAEWETEHSAAPSTPHRL